MPGVWIERVISKLEMCCRKWLNPAGRRGATELKCRHAKRSVQKGISVTRRVKENKLVMNDLENTSEKTRLCLVGTGCHPRFTHIISSLVPLDKLQNL